MILLLAVLGFGIFLLVLVGVINILTDPMRVEEEEKIRIESEYI